MPRTSATLWFALFLACLTWTAPVPAQDGPAEDEQAAAAALEERATAATKALEAGLKSKDAAERRAAVLEVTGISHPVVARALGKAAGDKDSSVRVAAFDTLGTLGQEDALKELHRAAKKAKQMKDDPAALAALYRAIGRYGDKSSIEVLLDDPWLSMDNVAVKARIYALGNVRDTAAVEGLLSLTNLARPLPGEDSPFMPHFRVALARLTGTDQSTNKSLWQKWWRDNKQGFKVPEQAVPMPAEMQAPWHEFWDARDNGARGADGARGQDGADG
jgi:HEAT repeat protein